MRDLNLRYHEECCYTCRYLRVYTQRYASCGECLLLGRTMSIAGEFQSYMHISWNRSRVCDGWKKRPKTWHLYVQKNPHWYDDYIPRETLLRLRKKSKIK